jgi:putative ABC transport system permease protein
MTRPGVTGVARGNSSIVRLGPQTGDNEWKGKAEGQTMMVHPVAIDKDFIPFFKMQMAEGSNFTDAVSDSTHFILNEAAVKETGIKEPIGKPFRMWKTKGTIIGVIKDFHFASMRQKIGPAVFYYQPHDSRLVYVRTKPGESEKAVAAAAAQWKQYGRGYAFKYNFLDEQFDAMYASEQRTGVLSRIFSIIAILISCLGLLGLATYTAQVRTREIGVRKVLGASVADILRLLGSDFMRLVLLGIVIAAPLAWYLMSRWLEDFAYKIQLHWSLFLLAGFIGVAVALITISFQAVRAAVVNPVKSLRSE